MGRAERVALVLSLCLCFPLILAVYTSVYQPTTEIFNTTTQTSWCGIDDVIPVDCQNKKHKDCDSSCTLYVSFVPEGDTSPTYLESVFPLETCDYYYKGEEIQCLYLIRPETVYFEDQENCKVTGALITITSVVVLLWPISLLLLWIPFKIIDRILRKYSTSGTPEQMETPLHVINKDQGNNFPELEPGTKVRYALEEYLHSRNDVDSVIGVYSWRDASIFSLVGLILLSVSLLLLVLWITCIFLMGITFGEYVTCEANIWGTLLLPLLFGLLFGIGGWGFLFLSLVGLVLFWCWNIRSSSYIIALDDEILYFRKNCITGNVTLRGTLSLENPRLVARSTYYQFASTFSILFLFKWHPTVYINDDSGAFLPIPVFYSHAQPILVWLSQTFPGTGDGRRE